MIIQFECTECHKTLRVKEQYAGKRARCVHCGKPIWIPRRQETVNELLIDRSAPRTRYEASTSAEKFDVQCEACGKLISVGRQYAGARIQCTNDECMGMILATLPESRAKSKSADPVPDSSAAERPASLAEQTCAQIAGYLRAGYALLKLVTW